MEIRTVPEISTTLVLQQRSISIGATDTTGSADEPITPNRFAPSPAEPRSVGTRSRLRKCDSGVASIRVTTRPPPELGVRLQSRLIRQGATSADQVAPRHTGDGLGTHPRQVGAGPTVLASRAIWTGEAVLACPSAACRKSREFCDSAASSGF